MKDAIINFLREFNEDLVKDLDQNLFTEGILNSFCIINLVMELEDKFDIFIDVEDVNPENFQTTNHIIRLVERKSKQ